MTASRHGVMAPPAGISEGVGDAARRASPGVRPLRSTPPRLVRATMSSGPSSRANADPSAKNAAWTDQRQRHADHGDRQPKRPRPAAQGLTGKQRHDRHAGDNAPTPCEWKIAGEAWRLNCARSACADASSDAAATPQASLRSDFVHAHRRNLAAADMPAVLSRRRAAQPGSIVVACRPRLDFRRPLRSTSAAVTSMMIESLSAVLPVAICWPLRRRFAGAAVPPPSTVEAYAGAAVRRRPGHAERRRRGARRAAGGRAVHRRRGGRRPRPVPGDQGRAARGGCCGNCSRSIARATPRSISCFAATSRSSCRRSRPTAQPVRVTPLADAAGHARLLDEWWEQYANRWQGLRQDPQFPPVVENFLAANLARRLGR